MFLFLNFKPFNVFGSEILGRIFLPDGCIYERNLSTCVSMKHGRSVAVKIDDFDWILVKGIGWQFEGPQVFLPSKDKQLVFGLFGEKDAIREVAVSQELERLPLKFPKVLYYKLFKDYNISPEFAHICDIKYNDDTPVLPCLLYTRVTTPFRIADLQFMRDSEKNELIAAYSNYFDIDCDNFVPYFAEKLGERVALMHANGFINDSLEYDNVTICAEIIDYEWITAPNIPLPDGSSGLVIPDERKEKEFVYSVEVLLFLSRMLFTNFKFYDLLSFFIDGYSKYNHQFVNSNQKIQQILAKKIIII